MAGLARQARRSDREDLNQKVSEKREALLENSVKYRNLREVRRKEQADEEERQRKRRFEEARANAAQAREKERLAQAVQRAEAQKAFDAMQPIREDKWAARDARANREYREYMISLDRFCNLDNLLPAY